MATDSLGELTVDLIAKTGGFEQGMDRAQRALKSATKEAAYQAGQLDKLVGQIDPVIAAYGRLDKMEEQLRKHREAGRLDEVDFKDYISKLNDQRAAVQKSNDVMADGAMSSKAYAAALRTVPAQFTDIITSLQGGQAPLTVLLQQGGQLKDQFGGIGPAAKALGGYISGLINPATLAAGSIAALGYAYYQSAQQQSEFSKALFAGNQTLGLNGDQLLSLAKQAGAASESIGDAESAIKALAASGKVSASQIGSLGTAAAAVSQYTGRDVEDVAKAFAGLGESATEAAQKASQQYGLVTASQYEIIKALDDQGEHQKALDTLAESLNQNALARLKDYKGSLSDIEQAWLAVKNAISSAYSGIKESLDPGLDKQISDLQELLNNRSTGWLAKVFKSDLGSDSDSTRFLQTKLNGLLKQRDANKANAEAQAEFNKANQDYISLSAKADAELANTSPAEKKKKAIQDLNDEYFALMEASSRAGKSSPILAGVDYDGKNFSGGSYAKRLQKIDDDYAKATKGPKQKAYQEDAATKLLDNLKQQNAELQAQGALTDSQIGKSQTLGTNAKALAAWEQQLADIKSKQTLTADQKSLLANADKLTAQYKSNAELEKEVHLRKEAADEARKLLAFQDNLASQLASARDGLDANLAGMGMGSVQQQRIQEQVRIQQSYQTQLDRLEAQHNRGDIKDSLYANETIALRQALSDRLKIQQDYYAQVDAAQANWKLGASSAYQDYLQSAADVAGQTKTLFSDAFSGMEDSIVEFAKTGKLSFSNFAESVIEDMARMAARQATVGLLNLGISAIGGLFSGGGSASLGASQAGYSSTYFPQTTGARAVGGLVSPNSLYQVNERGPELYSQDGKSYLMTGSGGGSVVPLGNSGSSIGQASSGGQVVIQQNINVPAAGSDGGAGSGTDMNALASVYAKAARDGAQQEIAKQTQHGGMIWQAINRPQR